MLCVIATNSVACRFFHYEKASAKLSFIKEITHPENRLKKKNILLQINQEVLNPVFHPKDRMNNVPIPKLMK